MHRVFRGDHAGWRFCNNVAYYVVEHFSQFVPPGSVRVTSSEIEQLASVAFLAPEGKVVLVFQTREISRSPSR
jgi:glucosylceramidase